MTETADVRGTDVPDHMIVSALAGDRLAVEAVVSIIEPLVVHYCRARLGGPGRRGGRADDIAREVCVAVVAALPGYRMQGRPFLGFVFAIASQTVIDAHGHALGDRSEPVTAVPETREVPETGKVTDGPPHGARHADMPGQVERLLARLPDDQREVLMLRIAVGLSVQETADAVGTTPAAVRVAQHRALAGLRKFLREQGDEPSA